MYTTWERRHLNSFTLGRRGISGLESVAENAGTETRHCDMPAQLGSQCTCDASAVCTSTYCSYRRSTDSRPGVSQREVCSDRSWKWSAHSRAIWECVERSIQRSAGRRRALVTTGLSSKWFQNQIWFLVKIYLVLLCNAFWFRTPEVCVWHSNIKLYCTLHLQWKYLQKVSNNILYFLKIFLNLIKMFKFAKKFKAINFIYNSVFNLLQTFTNIISY